MAKRIYVGGLPYSVDETQLESLFTPYGQVSDVHVVTDRFTAQPRGFAFVEMVDDSAAESAINALNGTQLGGRTLTVNEAQPREARAPRSGGGGGGYGGGGGGGYGGGGGGYGGGGGGRGGGGGGRRGGGGDRDRW